MIKDDSLMKLWGVDVNGFKSFVASRMPTLQLPQHRVKLYQDASQAFDESKAFNSLAFIAIMTLISTQKNLPLKNEEVVKSIKTNPDDFEWLQVYIYLLVGFLSVNDQIFEIVNGSNGTTPNWSVSVDTTRNIIDRDVVGTYARMAIANSEITRYKFFATKEETNLFVRNSNGLVQFIGEVK